MNELMGYVSGLKSIIDNHYEKETVFYNDGEWYSRYHSKNISYQELIEWAKEITLKDFLSSEESIEVIYKQEEMLENLLNAFAGVCLELDKYLDVPSRPNVEDEMSEEEYERLQNIAMEIDMYLQFRRGDDDEEFDAE